MTLITTVLAFLLAIGPLIIFHELGHYTVARLCGVKVLRFSFGFGKIIWSRRFGPDGTEWALSALPLGGYVKMLDNRDPANAASSPADLKREFTSQSVWKRFAIIAAGPLTNFLIAIVMFAGLYMHGIDEPSTTVRVMADTTAAYKAGVRGGDRILAVNDKPVSSWSELHWEALDPILDKSELRLQLAQPGGAEYSAIIPASALAATDVEGDALGTLGLSMKREPAVLGKILPGSAAARAGLQTDDLVTAIDGKPVPDGIALIDAVRASPGRALVFAGVRAGQPFETPVTPEMDPVAKVARIGAEVAPPRPIMVSVQRGPVDAVFKGMRTTWDKSVMQVKMIGKMITGQLSVKNVTGPITIADYAGKTARAGAIEFLTFIAVISISLGVMNLLPIPVLDGGLLLYYSLEVLTGRPLPERIGELAQRAGVVLLLMLMMLAVFNDVVRLL